MTPLFYSGIGIKFGNDETKKQARQASYLAWAAEYFQNRKSDDIVGEVITYNYFEVFPQYRNAWYMASQHGTTSTEAEQVYHPDSIP